MKSLLESLTRDLRFGVRILLRSGGTTLAIMAALALGIGANSAMFTVVDAVLLHPVRYPDADKLALIWDRDAQGEIHNAAAANFLDWRAQSRSFSLLAGWTPSSYVLAGVDRPQQITGAAVTANFFRTLGVKPFLGRTFLPNEDGIDNPADASRVCVIAYRLWQESLGGDPNVLGRVLILNQTPYTVVGVMPPEFEFMAARHQVWVPAHLNRSDREYHYLTAIGRRSVPLAQASAEMSTISNSLDRAYPKSNKSWTIQVDDLQEFLVNHTFRRRLVLLAAALAVLLVIACTNIASLLLARSAGRTREIAIRISMGATRGRLVRQLLTESVLLAVAGGAAGLLLAHWLIQAAPGLLPPNVLPPGVGLNLNFNAVLFTFAVSLATGVLFGLAPALAATRPNVQETLRETSRATAGRGRQIFRKAMVIAEVAVALMLLVSASLMVSSLRKIAGIDLGFDPQNVLAWSLFLPATEYNAARSLEFHRRALEKISALPGVQSATVASSLPLSNPTMEVPFDLETAARDESERPGVGYASISPGYLHTLGISVKRGRGFTDADSEKAPPVAIVNQAFAARYFPNGNAVGQRLVLNRPILGGDGFQPPTHVEIVGVIANVMLGNLVSEATPMLYVPHAQGVWRRVSWFAVRTGANPARIASAIRHTMTELDKNQPIDNLGTMEQTFTRQFAEPRFQAQLMGAFAGLALLLAIVGIYGINAHAVAERRHEIALRMALGASPSRVLRDIIENGLKLTVCGIAIGIAGALAIASVLRSVLVGVSATDPLTLGGVALLLALVAAAACYIPARKATRIDPAVALRQE